MIKAFIGYFQRMRIPTKQEITDYYPNYLLVHRNPFNKILHIIGNILTLGFITGTVFLSWKNPIFLPLLILTPFIVYLGAWPGHRIFEKNKPATWNQNPLLTKSCDWIMMSQLLTRKIKLDGRPQMNLEFAKGSASQIKHIGIVDLEMWKDTAWQKMADVRKKRDNK